MSTELQQAMLAYINTSSNEDGLFSTAVHGLTLMRLSQPTLPGHFIYRPELCVVVQGAKSIMLGDQIIDYHAMQALVVSMSLPGIGRVTQASAQHPLLVLALELDLTLLGEVMTQINYPVRKPPETGLGVCVHDVSVAMADCLLRLIRLAASPHEIPVLLPLLLRELYYRLLTGPNGDKLVSLLGSPDLPGNYTRRMMDALSLLRSDFARPVRIEELAAAAGMSASAFHQRFKMLTSTTPLQYQKHLRLLEAKRLMVMENISVTVAAFQVGYESASQFSREYTRLFGIAPKHDVAAARQIYQRMIVDENVMSVQSA